MPVTLLDNNIILASASVRDDYHDRARAVIRGVDNGDLPEVMVTNYVVAAGRTHSRKRLSATAGCGPPARA